VSRLALIAAATLMLLALAARTRAVVDPHVDIGKVAGGCMACHRGHGAPRSPMLPVAQVALCLRCHGSASALERRIADGDVAAGARPALLDGVLAQPWVHPLDRGAFSRDGTQGVTCTSCHAPHRGLPAGRDAMASGRPYRSTRDPGRLEYELCQRCHGGAGSGTASLTDISRLTSPSNRSYHPIEAPVMATAPSVRAELAGREINCTDCHGNSDPGGPRGPHGSAVPFLLRARYATADGGPESAATYALCYDCHRRAAVLDGAFPEHRRHVVELRTSCATCHNAHGSVRNAALIRFGEETVIGGVAPSLTSGRLAFVSDGPGSGACYLTCHGVDHAPATYGLALPGTAGTPVQPFDPP